MAKQSRFALWWIVLCFMVGRVAFAQSDDRLIGIWSIQKSSQLIEYLFRSDGRYQIDTKSLDPDFDYSETERGRYSVNGQVLTFTPYDFFGNPSSRTYEFRFIGDSLGLTRIDFLLDEVIYQFKPGSREDVLARQNVDTVLIGTWMRPLIYYGKSEYTFRPGGYYFIKNTDDDGQFPPEYIRGRYTQVGKQLTLKPYSGTEAQFELDFFGNTLTLIDTNEYSGHSTSFEEVAGSQAEVLAKSAAAEAFLSSTNWQVGIWDIPNGAKKVELTIRPDGHYIATNDVEILRGIVRGRYVLEPRRIHLFPFIGQGLYSSD
ncbi:MAG TPA: hypothetical protein VEC99_06370, partial [Clostridia bacterium]|nr:hypothetical protein [Clostridia bacterium]